MKLLLGILLALVLIEGVAIVGLYLRQEPAQPAASPSAASQGAPSSEPVANPPGDQSKQLSELTAKVETLQKQLDSLQSVLRREDVSAAPDSAMDLQAEAFTSRVRELSLQAVQEAEEQKRLQAFQDQAPQHAGHLAEKWPVRFGTVGDLETVLVEWYSRLRPVYLKYSPSGKMPTRSDPNYDDWISEFKSIEQWGVGELQRLYGTPLDPDLEGSARHLVYVVGTAAK